MKFKSFLNEKDSDMKTITVLCRDNNNTLENLIKYIASNGNGGHSFSIIVDPDGDTDQRKSFGWDGDGSDYIKDVKVSK